MKYFIILTTVIFSFASADIKIVASKICKIELIHKSDIKKLFMLKKSSIDGESIKIIDSSDKKVYREFIKRYLRKSPRKIKIYWVRMLFTGRKIPPKKLSLKELDYLDGEDGCYLSYMEIERKPKEWKIVKIK